MASGNISFHENFDRRQLARNRKSQNYDGHRKPKRQRYYGFENFVKDYQHTGVNINYSSAKYNNRYRKWSKNSSPNKTDRKNNKLSLLDYEIDVEPTPLPSSWSKFVQPVISKAQNDNEKKIKSSIKCSDDENNKYDHGKDILFKNSPPKVEDKIDSAQTSSITLCLEPTNPDLQFSPNKSPFVPCGQQDNLNVSVDNEDKLSLLNHFFSNSPPPSLPAMFSRSSSDQGQLYEQFANYENTLFSNNEVNSFPNVQNCDDMFNFSLTAGQRIADSSVDLVKSLIDKTFITDSDISNHSVCQNEFKNITTNTKSDLNLHKSDLVLTTNSSHVCQNDKLKKPHKKNIKLESSFSMCNCDSESMLNVNSNHVRQKDKLNRSNFENASIDMKSKSAISTCPNLSESYCEYNKVNFSDANNPSSNGMLLLTKPSNNLNANVSNNDNSFLALSKQTEGNSHSPVTDKLNLLSNNIIVDTKPSFSNKGYIVHPEVNIALTSTQLYESLRKLSFPKLSPISKSLHQDVDNDNSGLPNMNINILGNTLLESIETEKLTSDTSKLFNKSRAVQDLMIKLKNDYNTEINYQPVVLLDHLPIVGVVNDGKNDNYNLETKENIEVIETTITNDNHAIINDITIENHNDINEHEADVLNNYDLNVKLILKTVKKLFDTKRKEFLKDKSATYNFIVNIIYGENDKESLSFNLNLDENAQNTKAQYSTVNIEAKRSNKSSKKSKFTESEKLVSQLDFSRHEEPMNLNADATDDVISITKKKDEKSSAYNLNMEAIDDLPTTIEQPWWEKAVYESENSLNKSRKKGKQSKISARKSNDVISTKKKKDKKSEPSKISESDESDIDLAYDEQGKIILKRRNKRDNELSTLSNETSPKSCVGKSIDRESVTYDIVSIETRSNIIDDMEPEGFDSEFLGFPSKKVEVELPVIIDKFHPSCRNFSDSITAEATIPWSQTLKNRLLTISTLKSESIKNTLMQHKSSKSNGEILCKVMKKKKKKKPTLGKKIFKNSLLELSKLMKASNKYSLIQHNSSSNGERMCRAFKDHNRPINKQKCPFQWV